MDATPLLLCTSSWIILCRYTHLKDVGCGCGTYMVTHILMIIMFQVLHVGLLNNSVRSSSYVILLLTAHSSQGVFHICEQYTLLTTEIIELWVCNAGQLIDWLLASFTSLRLEFTRVSIFTEEITFSSPYLHTCTSLIKKGIVPLWSAVSVLSDGTICNISFNKKWLLCGLSWEGCIIITLYACVHACVRVCVHECVYV